MNLFLRKMKGCSLWISLAAAVLALSGCETAGGGGAANAPGAPPAEPAALGAGLMGTDLIHAGDRVLVLLSDIPNPYPPVEQRVREDGTITLPLDVKVVAAGKKAGELEVEIQKEYVPKFYRRMTVSVKPEERFIYVGGCVRMPNRYVHAGEMTVLKAIKVAGDFTDYANKRKVELIRADKTKLNINCIKAQKDPKLDLPVYPGDYIHVYQRHI